VGAFLNGYFMPVACQKGGMRRIDTHTSHMLAALCLMVVTAADAHAETFTWEDIKEPFNQTFRFSRAEAAVVQVSIPRDVLASSGRVSIFLNIDKNRPRLRPYMIVNNNREALYYLGGNGIVNIRSGHLKAGVNELHFRDQTITGDLIFVYEMRLIEFKN